MALKLATFLLFLWFLARLAGWRPKVSPVIVETLSFRKTAGQTADDSESDSAESALQEGPRSVAGGIAHVSPGKSWSAVDDEPRETLAQRWTSWLERWSTGAPAVVHEAIDPGPTEREREREELIAHLLRERARTAPSLPATRIVESAADQEGVPWGRVSRATVWRVWRELP